MHIFLHCELSYKQFFYLNTCVFGFRFILKTKILKCIFNVLFSLFVLFSKLNLQFKLCKLNFSREVCVKMFTSTVLVILSL